jgi:CDP-paratose 2-epimerase
MLEGHLGKDIPVDFHDWRPGDQKVYVSDIRKASRDFGWEPKVDVAVGVRRLFEWVQANPELFDV